MKRGLSAREIALFGMLGTMMYAAKVAMAALPNIEPVSLMVMLLAVCLGWRGLFSVYLYVFLEYALWGIDLWSVCYVYVWLILFIAARGMQRMRSPLGWAILSGGFGLLFGVLCAPVYLLTGGWSTAISWWIAGIPMDLIHGISNFVIALVLFEPLRLWLERLSRWWKRHEKT